MTTKRVAGQDYTLEYDLERIGMESDARSCHIHVNWFALLFGKTDNFTRLVNERHVSCGNDIHVFPKELHILGLVKLGLVAKFHTKGGSYHNSTETAVEFHC